MSHGCGGAVRRACMTGLLWVAAIASAPAVASDTDGGAVDGAAAPDRAEYVRLGRELEQLAARNAWSGVERTYHKLRQTGIALGFEHHFAGAQAARALGDVHAARRRLDAAHALREDPQVVNWMFEIDSKYGRVTLACEPGKHRLELTAENVPFQPDMRQAVEFAARRVAERCAFDGLLPHGSYSFGGHPFVVQGVQAVKIDLRHAQPVDRGERRRRKGGARDR